MAETKLDIIISAQDKASAKMSGVLDALEDMDTTVDGLAVTMEEFGETITEAFERLEKSGADKASKSLQKVNTAANVATAALTGLRTAAGNLGKVLSGLAGIVKGAISGIVGFAKGVLRLAANIAKVAIKAFVAGIKAIANAAKWAATELVKLAKEVFNLVEEGAKLQGMEDAFVGMGEGMDKMLSALQKASGGMATNTALMENYNSAALLVSKTFANELPQALEYISKIAAATGNSVEQFMSDFVRGIGRESPMILDNLTLKLGTMEDVVRRWAETNREAAMSMIDNTEAVVDMKNKIADLRDQLHLATMKQSEFTEKTSESTKEANRQRIAKLRKEIASLTGGISDLGDAARDFSDDEIRQMIEGMDEATRKTILTADAMEQLQRKAAGLPEIVNPVAKIKTAWQNLSDTFKKTISKIMLPWLEKIEPLVTEIMFLFEKWVLGVDVTGEIADRVRKLPKPLQVFLNVAREVVRFFTTAFQFGIGAAVAQLESTIRNYIGEDAYNTLKGFVENVKDKFDQAKNFINSFTEEGGGWEKIKIRFNELKEGFNRIGEAYEQHLKEPLNNLKDAILKAFGVESSKGTQGFWDTLSGFIDWLVEEGMPRLGDFIQMVSEELPGWIEDGKQKIEEIKETFAGWMTTIDETMESLNKINGAFTGIGESSTTIGSVVTIFTTLGKVIGGIVNVSLSILRKEFELIVWFISTQLNYIITGVNKLLGKESGGLTFTIDNLIGALERFIKWLGEVASAISEIELPDWLTPGSPTPFETALVGINKQMVSWSDNVKEVSKNINALSSLPQGQMRLALQQSGAQYAVTAPGGGRSSGGVTVNYINQGVSLANETEIVNTLAPIVERAAAKGQRRQGDATAARWQGRRGSM